MIHQHQPLYRYILRDALRIVWQHKFLWVFGFFVALLGNGGVYEVIIRGLNRAVLKSAFAGVAIPSIFTIATKMKALVFSVANTRSVVEFVLFIFGVILIVLLYIALTSYGMSSLIVATRKIFQGRKTTFIDSLAEGKSALLNVAIINTIAKVVISSLIALSALPLGWLLAKNQAVFAITYVFGFVILISVGLFISFSAIYTGCSAVLHSKHFLAATHDAFKVFRNHAVVSIEMALVLFLINLGVSLVFLTILVSFLGIIGFALTMLAVAKLNILFWTVVLLALIVLATTIIFVGSFLGAFQLASWTILYMKISRGGAVSKIVRLVSHIPHLVKRI